MLIHFHATLKKVFNRKSHSWNSTLKSSIIEISLFFLYCVCKWLLFECAVLALRFKWHSWKLIGGQIICISCSVSRLCVCPWVSLSFSPSHSHPFFIFLTQARFPHSSLLSVFLILSLAFLPYYLISFSSPSEKLIPHFPPTPSLHIIPKFSFRLALSVSLIRKMISYESSEWRWHFNDCQSCRCYLVNECYHHALGST